MGALLLLGAELSQRDEPRGDGRLREGPGAVAAAPCVPAVLRQTRCCKAPDFRPRAPAPSASIPARDRDRPCRARFEDRALLVRSRWGTRRLRGHRRAASTGRMSARRPRCLIAASRPRRRPDPCPSSSVRTVSSLLERPGQGARPDEAASSPQTEAVFVFQDSPGASSPGPVATPGIALSAPAL